VKGRGAPRGFGVAGWLMADLVVVVAFLATALNGAGSAPTSPSPPTHTSSTKSTGIPNDATDPTPQSICPKPGLDLTWVTTSVVNIPPGGGEAQADELAGQILDDGRQPGVVMLFGVSWDGNELNGVLVSETMETHLRYRLPEGVVYRSFLQGFDGGNFQRGDVYAEVFYFTSG